MIWYLSTEPSTRSVLNQDHNDFDGSRFLGNSKNHFHQRKAIACGKDLYNSRNMTITDRESDFVLDFRDISYEIEHLRT